jgi:hypothetical protein
MEKHLNLHTGFIFHFGFHKYFTIYYGRTQTMKYYLNDDVFSIGSACFEQVEPMEISNLI